MGLFDRILIAVIIGGAVWLLYHSLWKKKGCCGSDGCGGSCNGYDSQLPASKHHLKRYD